MSIRFGTDGVRGPAGTWPIDPEGAARIGRAAVALARSLGGARVLVGRDPRPSGSELAAAVVRGAAAAGGRVLEGGVLPTSAVGFAVDAGLADVGVMVTASHNRAADNGFKVLGSAGRKLDDEQIARFEHWLGEEPSGGPVGSVTDARARALAGWRTTAEAALGDLGSLTGRRVAVDLAAGASTAVLPWLRTLPIDLVAVGTSGIINDGFGSEHPGALQRAVVEHGCAAGIAVDGDGDRCLLVDERGARVSGDALIWLLAHRLGVGALAVTVMSNGALEAALPGVRVVRTPVGDRHLREAMDREALPLGCEESGHVLFAGLAGGDGLITGLRAVSLGLRDGPLSVATSGFAPLPRRVAKLRVARRPPLDTVDGLREACREEEARLGENGRILLRYSGTEPVLRLLVEGDETVVDDVIERVRQVAEESLA